MIDQGLVRFFAVDLPTVIIAYLLINYGTTWAVIFAIGQGFLIDIFSSGLLGLFSVLYLITFISIKVGSSFFDLDSLRGRIFLISIAVFLKEIFLIAFLKAFAMEIFISLTDFLAFITSAFFSGLISPILFFVFNLMSRILTRKEKDIL
jgi:rod shape-determining protein MreD